VGGTRLKDTICLDKLQLDVVFPYFYALPISMLYLCPDIISMAV